MINILVEFESQLEHGISLLNWLTFSDPQNDHVPNYKVPVKQA